jgi:hypothetical protein
MKALLILLLIATAYAADECYEVTDEKGEKISPAAADEDVQKIDVCMHYKDKTCCPTLNTLGGAADLYSKQLLYQALGSGSCATWPLIFQCRKCNPEMVDSKWREENYDNGACKSVADDFFDACKDTKGFVYKISKDKESFLSSSEGSAVLSDVWSSAEKYWDESGLALGGGTYKNLPEDKCWSAGNIVVPALLSLLLPLLALF